jgi:hypothetical protein
LLIVDEAHENYFAKTVQNIISKTKPKKQILLTGTPYQFIGKDDFKIHFLSLNELNKSIIPKLRVDIIESNYNWNGNYNKLKEIKKAFNFNDVDTKATLDKTFQFILNRNNIKKKEVSKTLVICNNIKQSELVKKYLDVFGLSSVLSNSKNDTKSLLIQDFKRNKINILIVVNRARLGYDDIDLINLIDMSGTLNPNLIYQMMARVLRGSSNVQKYYIRLTSKKDDSLNSEIATNLALMLTDKSYISSFNGKNFDMQTIIVPNYFSKKYIRNSSNFSKNSPKLLIDTYDIISFYRDAISDTDKENGVYKFCKIKDVLAELGSKKKFVEEKSLEYLKKIALNYTGRFEWQKKDTKNYSYAKNRGWLDECCKHMKQFRREYTLKSCKESASKFKTIRDWNNADTNSVCASRRNGWYKECITHMDSLLVFRTLEQCKESASKYTLKEDWKRADYNTYQSSRINGWYEECTAHMKNTFVKYTLEYCKKVASKYKSNAEFYKFDYNVYQRAYIRGWLEECRKGMILGRQYRKKFDLDTCIKIASNFYTKSLWRKADLHSYNRARINGWLEECCKHFKK